MEIKKKINKKGVGDKKKKKKTSTNLAQLIESTRIVDFNEETVLIRLINEKLVDDLDGRDAAFETVQDDATHTLPLVADLDVGEVEICVCNETNEVGRSLTRQHRQGEAVQVGRPIEKLL